jgi:hypothetical protein
MEPRIVLGAVGLAALACCFSLGYWPGVVVLVAMFALSQQNRIENLLVHGLGEAAHWPAMTARENEPDETA